MRLDGNKLTPSVGMYLQRISDGSVAEGAMWIPPSLRDDFKEITRDEYLELSQQTDTDTTDDISERVSKLEKQLNNNITEVASLQKVISTIQGMLTGFDNLTKIKGE